MNLTRTPATALTLALGGLLVLAGWAAGPAARAEEMTGHPAHIHNGTCDTLGDVAFPLSDVGPGATMNGTPQAGGEQVGATTDIYPAQISVTSIDAPLTAIADGKHAINIHESATKIDNYIACGNIGGTMTGDDLAIGLEQLNVSGYSGIAVLHRDGDKTTVTVYLAEGLAGNQASAGTPAAGDPAAASASSVAIENFAFGPDTLTVPVGTTVTWTNDDSVNHTVTSDQGTFDSGPLANGQTFSQTFDQAGTFTYHCTIHSSMQGTVVVH